VEFAVVEPAEGDRELVADLAAERADLSEAEVVRVARLSPANEAGPRSDKLDVGLVPVAARLRDGQHALVDAGELSPNLGDGRGQAAAA
jgi:hypothetical protein